MVSTLTMMVILSMWVTLTWAVTYMVTSHRRHEQIASLEHHLREANDLIDDLMYHEMNKDPYAEYKLDEYNQWYRAN
jgi:thiosulfate reductase cytochrome b subunit